MKLRLLNARIRMIAACVLGCAALAISGCGQKETVSSAEKGAVVETEASAETSAGTAAEAAEQKGAVLSEQAIEKWNSMDISELFKMSRSEIIETFGSDYEIREPGSEHAWMEYEIGNEDGKSHQNVAFVFNKELPDLDVPEIIEINLYNAVVTYEGIYQEDSIDDAAQKLISTGWRLQDTMDAGHGLIVYNLERFDEKGIYQCQFLVNEDILEGITLSNCDMYFATEPEEPETEQPEIEMTEPEETEEAKDAVPKEEVSIAPTEPKAELGAALTNDEARDILFEHFKKYYSAGNLYFCYGDITHDGIDEMFTISNQEMYGYMDILCVVDGEVQKIFEAYNDNTTNGMYRYRYYIEDGKSYIIYAGFFMRQGHPLSFYEIFHLTEDGKQILLRKNEYDYDVVGENYELMEQVEAEYDVYYPKSVPILDFDNDGYVLSGEW